MKALETADKPNKEQESALIKIVKERLNYNPLTGDLTWMDSSNVSARLRGKIAGSVDSRGYRRIGLGGKTHGAHRIAFVHYHSLVPEMVDHVNGVRDDNRISNLRECSRHQNQCNRVMKRSKEDLPTGVVKRGRKYRAQINYKRKRHFLGLFATPELASRAYRKKRRELHGDYSVEHRLEASL